MVWPGGYRKRFCDLLPLQPWHDLRGAECPAIDRRVMCEDLLRRIADAPKFVVDNVTQYLFTEMPQERFEFERDFPNVAPPFAEYWMETYRPTSIMSAEFGSSPWTDSRPIRWGVLMTAERGEAMLARMTPGEMQSRLRSQMDALIRSDPSLLAEAERLVAEAKQRGTKFTIDEVLNRSTRLGQVALLELACRGLPEQAITPDSWYGQALIFLQMPPGRIIRPFFCAIYCAQADGTPTTMRLATVAATFSAEMTRGLVDTINPLLFPFWLALSFLHCRNVRETAMVPPPEVAAQHLRQYKRDLASYHVLEIEPMRHVLAPHAAGAHGLARALHICRGHFKHYEQRPLFGKHRGLFWWDAQVRGTAEAGRVEKDYVVKPPRDEG